MSKKLTNFYPLFKKLLNRTDSNAQPGFCFRFFKNSFHNHNLWNTYLKSQKIVFSRNKLWALTVPANNQAWVLSWWMFNVYRKGWLIEPVQYIETNCIMLVNKGLFCHLVTSTVYPLLSNEVYILWHICILSGLLRQNMPQNINFIYPFPIFVKRKFWVCFDFKKSNCELEKNIFYLENKLDLDWLSWEKRAKESLQKWYFVTKIVLTYCEKKLF